MRGAVPHSGDAGFDDEARVVFNSRTADTLPRAGAAAQRDEHDVATALRYSAARDLPVAVRGGGHGAEG